MPLTRDEADTLVKFLFKYLDPVDASLSVQTLVQDDPIHQGLLEGAIAHVAKDAGWVHERAVRKARAFMSRKQHPTD